MITREPRTNGDINRQLVTLSLKLLQFCINGALQMIDDEQENFLPVFVPILEMICRGESYSGITGHNLATFLKSNLRKQKSHFSYMPKVYMPERVRE